jgi:hypothetical protein
MDDVRDRDARGERRLRTLQPARASLVRKFAAMRVAELAVQSAATLSDCRATLAVDFLG